MIVNSNTNDAYYSKKKPMKTNPNQKKRHSGKQTGGNPIFRTCFVGGLHIRLKEGELLKYMKKYHPSIEIESIKFIQGKKEKDANRGFGFMTFKNEEDYRKVLKLKIVLRGKTINFRKAKSYQELQSNQKSLFKNRVIVKNLPKNVDDEELYKVFESFNWDLERCYVIKDSNTLVSKRIAFLDFANTKDLEECLKSTYVFKLGGKILTLEHFDENKSQTVGNNPSKRNLPNGEETSDSFGSNNQSKNENSNNNERPNNQDKEEKVASLWTFLYPTKKKLLNEDEYNYRINQRGPIFRSNYGFYPYSKYFDSNLIFG